MEKISVIIPVYNEEEGLPGVLEELARAREKCNIDEIIVVDDCSSDGSVALAKKMGANVICHRMNQGYGASLKTGIRKARNEVLVFLDGDGQHDPTDISKLAASLAKGNDMAIGERQNAAKIAGNRRLGKIILRWLTNSIADIKIADINCGFRAARKSVIEKYLPLLSDQFSFSVTSTIVFIKNRHCIEFCPIKARFRKGVSHVRPVRDGMNFIFLVIRLMALFAPLRIFFSMAVFLILTGTVYGAYKIITIGQGLPVGALMIILSGFLSGLMGIICDQIAALRLERYR